MDLELHTLLKTRKEFLEELIQTKSKRWFGAPADKLRVSVSHGCPTYYLVTDPKNTTGRYLSKKDMDRIKFLAQKDYDQKVLAYADKVLLIINSLLELNDRTVEDIYLNLTPIRQQLELPVRPTDEQLIEQWRESKACEPMGFSESDPEIMTEAGHRVRSLAEQLWADTMFREKVSYFFERVLELKGRGKVRPDFAALNVRKRKEFHIEHLGMMDDPAYLEKNLLKLRDYERSGYVLGVNFLYTLGTKKHPLQLKTVESLINNHLK